MTKNFSKTLSNHVIINGLSNLEVEEMELLNEFSKQA
jgi:hypothetical protein